MTDLTPERVRAWLDAGHSTNSDDAPNFEAVARSWLKQREALSVIETLADMEVPGVSIADVVRQAIKLSEQIAKGDI